MTISGKSAQVLTVASVALLSTIFLGASVKTIQGEKVLGRSSEGIGFSSNQTVVTEILSKLRLSGVLTTSISSHSASENEDQADERSDSDAIIDTNDGTDFVERVCAELSELARLIALDPPSQWTGLLSENMAAKPSRQAVHVILSIFDRAADLRLAEVLYSVWKNVLLPTVTKVHVLSEGISPPELISLMLCIWTTFVRNADNEGATSLAATMLERKLVVVEIEKQPTYGDFVEYAFAHCKNDLAIITNADIYFDKTLECVAKNVDEMRKSQVLISLTRTASQECPQHMSSKLGQDLWLAMIDEMHLRRKIEQPTFCGINKGTADSFMFVPTTEIEDAARAKKEQVKGALSPLENEYRLDFPQNRNGAENYFTEMMHELYGYAVVNPCRRIAGRHMHCFEDRTADTVQAPAGQKRKFPLDYWTLPPWLSTCSLENITLWTIWGLEPVGPSRLNWEGPDKAFDSLRKQGFAEVVHARAAAINALADPAK